MILYHGTNEDFDIIDINKSKPNKDFGKGFYLSDNYQQAMDLAEIKFEQMDAGLPIVLKFELDELKMKELKQLRFEHYSAEWAHFIVENRTNKTRNPIHDYDFIYGPIADDRVGVQLWRYENGMIDFDTMLKRIQYMKGETFQYFLGTERAISLLR